MKASNVALGCCAAAALLAGCGGSQNASPAALPNAALPAVAQAASKAPARTWMSPGAKRRDLLYVSDDRGVVYVFDYPGGSLVGTIAGLNGPSGLCSDSAGNVYVTETGAQDILKFPHGARKPSATLFDFGAFPDGCAVDPTTGNLAVTDYATSPSQGPGNVLIYPSGSGNPVKYANANFNVYLFCGYDAHGNLLVDGLNGPSTEAEFAELPRGGKNLKPVTLDTTIAYPGAVQWDGKYFAIEDVAKGNVYQFGIAKGKGTRQGTVHVGVRSKLIVQFAIDGSRLIVPFGATPRSVRKVGYWAYPAGGSPTQVLQAPGAVQLVGTAISHVVSP